MGPSSGLEGCGKFCPHRDPFSDRPGLSESLYRLSYPVLNLVFSKTVTGVLISPLPEPNEETIERFPFFVRRGGHCCHGDQVGRTTF